MDVKRQILFLIFLLLFLPKLSFAWSSGGGPANTHYRMSQDAISTLDAKEYPDIDRYQFILDEGSASEDAHAYGGSPSNPIFNGGDVYNWWIKTVLPAYKSYDFFTAYFKIGEVCHLTQDQAVPAHGANIQHGETNGVTH
jgi:hypothetical protein